MTSPFSSCKTALGLGETPVRAINALVEGLTAGKDTPSADLFGFLYVTDDLAPYLGGIVGDLVDYTGIQNWYGAPVLGVMEGDQRIVGENGMVALALPWAEGVVCPFPGGFTAQEAHFDNLTRWLEKNISPSVWCQISPLAEQNPDETLAALADIAGGYVMGPMVSGRTAPVFVVGNHVLSVGFAGLALGDALSVHTALVTGAEALGPIRTASCAPDGTIIALDGRRPGDCFLDDCRAQLGRAVTLALSDSIDVALHTNTGSDTARYTLMAIDGLNVDGDHMRLKQPVTDGARVQFMKRNPASFGTDYEARSLALRRRAPAARAGIYCADIALTARDFDKDRHDWALARRCLPDLPMIGIYTDGVIADGRIHRGSALLTLFE